MLKNGGVSYDIGKYDVAALSSDLSISIKGDTPSEGNICIGSNGTITKASLKINGYIVSYDGKETTTTDLEDIEDITCNIFEDAAKLVYDDTGVCKTDDTTYEYMGGCYIKGTSTNNYVWYNGFMWRIMGINSDNTVRLITDDNVTALAYGLSTSYNANEGYIRDWLNEYFYSHLNSTKTIIQEGNYFCSQSSNGVALTEGRTTCTEENVIAAKVGIMAMDEYILSAPDKEDGTPDESLTYLNNKQVQWTMTPFNDTKVAYLATGWITWEDPNAADNGKPAAAYGVRPVINIDPNSIVTTRNGQATDFFVLSENKNNDITGKLSDIVTSGEYVNLAGKTYRVVSKSDIGVKLILDEIYKEYDEEGNLQTISFGDNNTFTLDSGIGAKLNGDVLTWLGLSNSDKIVTTTYFQGDGYIHSASYSDTLKETNGVESTVGLIKMGEMLATQSSTMLTKNYTDSYKTGNTNFYWTMNKYTDEQKVWYIFPNGNAVSNKNSSYKYCIRPVITVKNDLNIASGNGTWTNPYEI